MSALTGVQNQIQTLQNNTAQVNYQRGLEHLGKTSLDKNAFLQLLMAQLANQDPLSPVDNSQFLSQQAQLSQVEKLDQLVDVLGGTQMLSQASTLVGKNVDIKDGDNTITGKVTSASIVDDKVTVLVNGKDYLAKNITTVYAPSA